MKNNLTANQHIWELTRMVSNDKGIIYKELSYKIIGLALEVHKEPGFGFLEKVYENSTLI